MRQLFYFNNIKRNLSSLGNLSDINSSVSITADNNWWGNINTDVCNPIGSYLKNKDAKPTTNNDKVTVNNWYYLDVVDKSGNTIKKEITRIGDYVGNTFDFKLMFKLNNGKGDFNYPYFANDFNLTGDKLSLFDGEIYTNSITKRFAGDSLAFNMLTNEPNSTLTFKNDMFGARVPFTFKETYPLSRLQNIIDNVWENDSAYIYDDYKYDPSVDADMINGIIVNKTITIDGKGATIDLDHKTRGFYVDAPEVVFKNIKIINGNLGNGGMGGAIFLNSKFGEIINATFESNTADYGGAVAITENYVTVTNSTFKNNYASEKGAGIYVVAKGLRITNNLFDSNHAAYGEDPCVEGYTFYISFSDNNTYINNSITGIGGKDDEVNPSFNPKHDTIKQSATANHKSHAKQVSHDKITVKSNNKQIPLSNNQLTLDVLNQIFNQNFTNGYLLVYIDGKVVFNATTTDDITQVIYDLLKLLSGNHEIKIVFTDKDGNTGNYTETITL